MIKTKAVTICLFFVWVIWLLDFGAYLVLGAWDLEFSFLHFLLLPFAFCL
jgi:hypothetical protein